jgi:hypothetical protein
MKRFKKIVSRRALQNEFLGRRSQDLLHKRLRCGETLFPKTIFLKRFILKRFY